MTGTMALHDQQVAVPTPGQLVTVRHRQWVVADVSRGEVASSDPHVLTGRALRSRLVTARLLLDEMCPPKPIDHHEETMPAASASPIHRVISPGASGCRHRGEERLDDDSYLAAVSFADYGV